MCRDCSTCNFHINCTNITVVRTAITVVVTKTGCISWDVKFRYKLLTLNSAFICWYLKMNLGAVKVTEVGRNAFP